MAMSRRLMMPERRMNSMIGGTVAAKRSDLRIETTPPLAAASAVLLGLPSLGPLALREESAARCEDQPIREDASHGHGVD